MYIYCNLWGLVDYSVAKMVWEQIGEKPDGQVKGFGLIVEVYWIFLSR